MAMGWGGVSWCFSPFFWFLFGGLCVPLDVMLRLLFAGPWADYVGEVAWGLGAVEASGGRVSSHQLLYKPHNRSEEHTSELQSRPHLVCRLLLEKKNKR